MKYLILTVLIGFSLQSLSKDKFHSLTAGRFTYCLIKGDMPYCFGNNYYVRGYAYADKKLRYAYPPRGLHTGGVTQISLSAWEYYGCAIKDGGVWCWGGNSYNSFLKRIALQPEALPVVDKDVTAISTSRGCACAIKKGALYCWGDNDQCPFTLTYEQREKYKNGMYYIIPIEGMQSGVTHVSGSNRYGCAIKDEEAYCWGINDGATISEKNFKYGERNSLDVTKITGLPKGIIDIVASSFFACALHRSGQVYCWGMAIDDGNKSGFIEGGSKEAKYFKIKYKTKLIGHKLTGRGRDNNDSLWFIPEAVPHPLYPKGSGVTKIKHSERFISVYKGKDYIDSMIGTGGYINKGRERVESGVKVNDATTKHGTCVIESSRTKALCNNTDSAYTPSLYCSTYRCDRDPIEVWREVEFAPASEIQRVYSKK